MPWSPVTLIVAGLIGLGLLARMLRVAESRISDAAKAKALAEELLAAFEAGPALVSGEGDAAIVAGRGAIAALKRRGTKVRAVRLLAPLRVFPSVEGVRIDTGDAQIGNITLFGVLADDVHRIEAASGF